MALQKDITLENGISVSDGYIRITTLEGNKNSLKYYVYLYNNYNSEYKLVQFLEEFSFIPSIEEGSYNWLKQAYEDLKLKDGYNDCQDV